MEELKKKEEELRKREEAIRKREQELGIGHGEKLLAEISSSQMTLRRGEETFTVPRDRFRAVYDAMQEAVKLSEGETKIVELLPKTPEQRRRGLIPW